jgi:hypothetical protein
MVEVALIAFTERGFFGVFMWLSANLAPLLFIHSLKPNFGEIPRMFPLKMT